MKVIPINVIDGKIDFDDFKSKVLTYKDNLAATMITFPSTAGIYDANIR
jgi:glycine dehydrogenase